MPLEDLMSLHGRDIEKAKAFSRGNPAKTLSKAQIASYVDGASLRAAQHQVIKSRLVSGESLRKVKI